MRGFEADFEKFGPAFAGDEEAVAGGVVGDAVEDIGAVAFPRREEAGEVDDAGDLAGLGIDADDVIRAPNVREDFAFDVFEFVEIHDRLAAICHANGVLGLQGFGIEETDLIGAVAHDERVAIGGKAPAFAGVGEFFFLVEGLEVVNETFLVLPGEVKDFAVEDGDAFAEILVGDADFFEDFAGFEFDFAQGGEAIQTGAFVENAIEENKALGECGAVVRIGVDDFVVVKGSGVVSRGGGFCRLYGLGGSKVAGGEEEDED